MAFLQNAQRYRADGMICVVNAVVGASDRDYVVRAGVPADVGYSFLEMDIIFQVYGFGRVR